jgi:hypothetical protein
LTPEVIVGALGGVNEEVRRTVGAVVAAGPKVIAGIEGPTPVLGADVPVTAGALVVTGAAEVASPVVLPVEGAPVTAGAAALVQPTLASSTDVTIRVGTVSLTVDGSIMPLTVACNPTSMVPAPVHEGQTPTERA